jgi:hypothetical protein
MASLTSHHLVAFFQGPLAFAVLALLLLFWPGRLLHLALPSRVAGSVKDGRFAPTAATFANTLPEPSGDIRQQAARSGSSIRACRSRLPGLKRAYHIVVLDNHDSVDREPGVSIEERSPFSGRFSFRAGSAHRC